MIPWQWLILAFILGGMFFGGIVASGYDRQKDTDKDEKRNFLAGIRGALRGEELR